MLNWTPCWTPYACSSQGKRAYQEDNYGVFESFGAPEQDHLLLVLADGMGGERGGAIASKLAVRQFIATFKNNSAVPIPQRLSESLEQANQIIADEVAARPYELSGMGCTLLAAVINAMELYWISVGDSPLWMCRDGQLARLNQDHSYRAVLAQQVAAGELTAEAAQRHPYQNALLSAVTGATLNMIDLTEEPVALHPDDQILLASDGLLTLSADTIAEKLMQSASGRTCQQLLAAVTAADLPYQDNVTVVLAKMAPKPVRNTTS